MSILKKMSIFCLSFCLIFGGVILRADIAFAKVTTLKFVTAGFQEGQLENAPEIMGADMLIGALDYRMRTYQPLKGKYRLKWVSTIFSDMDECLSGVASGAAEMTFSGPHYLEALEPAWKLGETPGVFNDWDHFIRSMKTPAWKALQDKMAEKKGVTIIKWYLNAGNFHIFTDKGPVNSLSDLQGQKIRIPGGEGPTKALQALGCTVISLPYTEVVTSLQTNMINGLITDVTSAINFYNLPRYTKYGINLPLGIQPVCIVANTKWWTSLPDADRQIIRDVFQRISVSQYFRANEEKVLQAWADDPKTELCNLTAQEAQKWRKLMQEATSGLSIDLPQDLIKAIDSTRYPKPNIE